MNNLDWKIKQSQKVIRFAHTLLGDRLGMAFTGRKDSTVMAHLILQTLGQAPPAMFIDHGLHFEETYQTLDKLSELMNIKVLRVADPEWLKKLNGEKVLKKKRIILQKLKIKTIKETVRDNHWQGLYVAIRADEQIERKNEKYFSPREDHMRIHPMLHFSEKDIWEYLTRFHLPFNPLYKEGYRSIGAKPFTKPIKEISSERTGRDQEKEAIMERLRALGYF